MAAFDRRLITLFFPSNSPFSNPCDPSSKRHAVYKKEKEILRQYTRFLMFKSKELVRLKEHHKMN